MRSFCVALLVLSITADLATAQAAVSRPLVPTGYGTWSTRASFGCPDEKMPEVTAQLFAREDPEAVEAVIEMVVSNTPFLYMYLQSIPTANMEFNYVYIARNDKWLFFSNVELADINEKYPATTLYSKFDQATAILRAIEPSRNTLSSTQMLLCVVSLEEEASRFLQSRFIKN